MAQTMFANYPQFLSENLDCLLGVIKVGVCPCRWGIGSVSCDDCGVGPCNNVVGSYL